MSTVLLMLPFLFAAGTAPGVYYSKTDVLFVAPRLSASGNALQEDPAQTLAFASVVTHRFNVDAGNTVPRSTSSPLYGTGIRRGHLLYIPSSGGQWQLSYNRPVITVEIVGESVNEVAFERQRILDRIASLAKDAQQELGVKPAANITTEPAPSVEFVAYVGVRNTTAVLVLVILTIGLAAGIPLSVDRALAARGRPGTGPQTRGMADGLAEPPELQSLAARPGEVLKSSP
ncbi:hypothetical protein [uncultured Arthrobacter sp.]|uniref:hypothetical protein n=1 Tax=uncultured Arthrobacter sp. TaxID=114050 RepID=UPI003217C0D0